MRGTGAAAKLALAGCTWEKDSILENSVLSVNATIERCANQVAYPILTYMAKCASGEFTDWMTIRNNRMVSDWKTVDGDGHVERDSWG